MLDDRTMIDQQTGNEIYTNRLYTSGNAGGAQGGSVIAARNPAHEKYDAERAVAVSKTYDAINEASSKAAQDIAVIRRMTQLSEGMKTGGLMPTLKEMSSIAQTMGVTFDSTLGDKEAFESLSNQLALNMHQPGTGELTDKDYMTFKEMVPRLAATPGGNATIIRTMDKFAQRRIKEAELAEKYRNLPGKGGRLDDAFLSRLSRWRSDNPIKW